MPPWTQNIFSSMRAATGIASKHTFTASQTLMTVRDESFTTFSRFPPHPISSQPRPVDSLRLANLSSEEITKLGEAFPFEGKHLLHSAEFVIPAKKVKLLRRQNLLREQVGYHLHRRAARMDSKLRHSIFTSIKNGEFCPLYLLLHRLFTHQFSSPILPRLPFLLCRRSLRERGMRRASESDPDAKEPFRRKSSRGNSRVNPQVCM